MNTQSLFSKFQERLSLIVRSQRAAQRFIQAQLHALHGHAGRRKEDGLGYDESMAFHSMTYVSPLNGESVGYGVHEQTVLDVIEALELHQNRQYQWLLAEAYEEYENFIEGVYAAIGSVDNDFWPPADFGSSPPTNLNSCDWNWYLQRAREKRGGPEAKLSQFRNKLTRFASLEISNALNINLRFSVALIAKMRHHIVHTSGKVSDREIFIGSVFKSLGISHSGSAASGYKEKINSFFYLNEPHNNTISLIDRRHPAARPELPVMSKVFENLIKELLSAAHCLQAAVSEHEDLILTKKN